jgi:2-polyprenyl-6-methoxyphenol hydroxylase-like FAD-dependent oxidoreductase
MQQTARELDSPKNIPKIIIIGAGLAGLCLAQALGHHPTHKFDVTVYERDGGPQGI